MTQSSNSRAIRTNALKEIVHSNRANSSGNKYDCVVTITPVRVGNGNGINMGIHPLYYTRDPDCRTKEHFSAILSTEVPLDTDNFAGGQERDWRSHIIYFP